MGLEIKNYNLKIILKIAKIVKIKNFVPNAVRNGAPTPYEHIISDSISSPFLGYFSPFPHGTCSLSIILSV